MEKENVIQKIQKLLKLQYGAESIGSTGEVNAAAAMYKERMPIAQIMETLGVKSNRTIYKYLQQKGIKANRK